MKKIIAICMLCALFITGAAAAFEWADEAVAYLLEKKVIAGDENGDLNLGGNLAASEAAKLVCESFSLKKAAKNNTAFSKYITEWFYDYICSVSELTGETFEPKQMITREQYMYWIIKAGGYENTVPKNAHVLDEKFADYRDIESKYYPAILVLADNGYVKGDDVGLLNPKSNLTRAEAFVIIARVQKNPPKNIVDPTKTQTPIIGEAKATVGQAKTWARKSGAHQRFIDIAEIYWKYGELTGIRPEVLYAQAAKETGFGKYMGRVTPEMNNWAGIKIKKPTGDSTEDHESFATPDDGVRAHYNHMAAYIGTKPIGEPHDRYYVVKSIDWAGTVKYVEELGGKWTPDPTYGATLVNNLLNPLLATVSEEPETPPEETGGQSFFKTFYAIIGHWAA